MHASDRHQRPNPATGLIAFARGGAIAVAFILLQSPPAAAECAKDRYGEVFCGAGRCDHDQDGTVWCSRFYEGDALTTREGRILCGKGRCAKSFNGEIFCSSVVGGAVLKDRNGRVRCQGRCEPATAAQCETTRADSAG